jgi:DNA phosphorothioation-dependent restriction protein DptG
MEKTQTSREWYEVDAAYHELQDAYDVFRDIVLKFKEVYNPVSLDLEGMIDGVGDVVCDIETDINNAFDDE